MGKVSCGGFRYRTTNDNIFKSKRHWPINTKGNPSSLPVPSIPNGRPNNPTWPPPPAPAEDDPLEGGESEEEEEVESGEEGSDDGSEPASLADLYESDVGSDDDEDPSFDPAADRGPEGEAALWSGMARLSISARKGRKGFVAPKMGKEDNDLLAMVEKLMRDDQLEKLKVYECKAYLRMHKLRLSGKKEDLLNRIREHIEVKILGELKYPASSFVLNCKGDACKGDVVVFEQNIYRRKKGDPRGVKSRLCGQRTNAGRIIKESYGTAKQQHTFTVEIFWNYGLPFILSS
ncbi:hypothetical protein ACQ4PT_048203 [Festuca glaucescens]